MIYRIFFKRASAYKLAVMFFAIGTFLFFQPVSAQENYPSRPITFVISTPPGSGSDIIGRRLADGLSHALGQPVIVENKGGAAGLVAAEAVARAKPDGYTMVWSANAALTTWPHIQHLTFNPLRDLKPVTLAVRFPIVWVKRANLPVSSIGQLIELDKRMQSSSSRLTVGNAGVGGQNQLATLMLNQMAGTNLLPIPYKGEGPALVALMGGQLDLIVTSLTSMVPHIKGGRISLLAAAGKQRISSLPNLKMVAEAGFPEYNIEGWGGVLVPANTPAGIVVRLNRALVNVLHTPAIIEFLEKNGSEAVGSTPEEFAQTIRKESAQHQELVKRFNIKAG